MSDYVEFDGRIVPLKWGKSVYTVLPLPQNVMNALARTKRVEGEINDHPINLAITRAPGIDTAFLWTGKSLLLEIGAKPGESVEVRLRPIDPGIVDLPDDISAALRASGKTARFQQLSAGKQRSLIHLVNTAKRPQTRAKRIATLIEGLE